MSCENIFKNSALEYYTPPERVKRNDSIVESVRIYPILNHLFKVDGDHFYGNTPDKMNKFAGREVVQYTMEQNAESVNLILERLKILGFNLLDHNGEWNN